LRERVAEQTTAPWAAARAHPGVGSALGQG